MRVVVPLTITDAILTSSTIAEPSSGETAYSSGTTYAIGDEVINATTHRKYQSLTAGNVGNALPSYPSETQNTNWLDIGPTNKWAMFDLIRNTQSVDDSPITVTLAPGVRINTVALLGVEGDTISITGVADAVTVYSYTADLRTRDVVTWYGYFFTPFNTDTSAIVFDLPPISGMSITIEITRATDQPKCGSVVIGNYTYIGAVQFGAVSDAQNYSTIDRDIFGNATLIPRRSVPKTQQKLIADSSLVNTIRNLRNNLNAVPAVWSGLDDLDSPYSEALLILGIYTSFSINLEYPFQAEIDLEIEEI